MGAVRPWGEISTHPLDFASVDSAMGHAADFALGLALAQPDKRVICLNGDGSMLMCLGTLVTIVASGARNLVLIVMQNGTYEITGNQPVPGGLELDYATVARGCGFRRAASFSDPEEYARAVPALLDGDGPVFASVLVHAGHDTPLRRAPDEPLPYLRPSLGESAHMLRLALTG